MRRGVGIGLIVLLLALAVVLVLSARNTARVSEAAAEAVQGDPARAEGTRAQSPEDSGGLPGLDDMKRATGEHGRRLEDALSPQTRSGSGED